MVADPGITPTAAIPAPKVPTSTKSSPAIPIREKRKSLGGVWFYIDNFRFQDHFISHAIQQACKK